MIFSTKNAIHFHLKFTDYFEFIGASVKGSHGGEWNLGAGTPEFTTIGLIATIVITIGFVVYIKIKK